MRLPALLRFAAGSLWRQKGRTALTVAGVAVGACGLAFSLALGLGLRAFIDREFHGRPAFWTVHVHPGRGAVVAEADIPAAAVEVAGEMSPERRARLRRLKVEAYQRGNPAGPPAALTPDRLAELAALPDVERVEAWHAQHAAVRFGVDGRRRHAQVVGGPLDAVAARVIAGRLPAAGADEAVVSESLLYELGLTDEAAVAAALGRPVEITLGHQPERGTSLGAALGLAGGDLTGVQEKLLDRVAETLPKAVDALDLTAAEKGLLGRLLADAKARKPAPTAKYALAEPVTGRLTLVGVVRDLTDAERYAADNLDPWETRHAEVFLPPAAGDRLFGRLPWVAERGYNAARVRVRPGGDLPAVAAGVTAAGFEKHDLLPFYRATRTQVTLTAAGLNLFALLALGVAGLGITNTLVTSVVERTREIGVMRAVGATAGQVRGLFLAEGAVIGLCGGLAGLALAVALTGPADRLVHRLIQEVSVDKVSAGTVFEFPLWLAAATVGFAGLLTTTAAWYPARRAARLAPVAALRG